MRQLCRDLLELSKPNILLMSILAAAGGLWLAPQSSPLAWLVGLTTVGLCVGSANALNMYWERESDLLMARTAKRPLPAGRLSASIALGYGLALGALGLGLAAWQVNGLTTLLGASMIGLYVLVYTPLKMRSPWALLIGAAPGALPALMGYTAGANAIASPGLVLFGILLLWQMPHFIAITLFRKQDYARAGIRTTNIVKGDQWARREGLAYATILLPVSLMLFPLGAAGALYFALALCIGLAFLVVTIRGFRPSEGAIGARRVFLASLMYLPALSLALVLDRLIQ